MFVTPPARYAVKVEVNGEEISGSPFHALAVDGITAGFTSSANGHGLTDAMAGVEDSFVVQARDVNANNRTLGGDTMTIVSIRSRRVLRCMLMHLWRVPLVLAQVLNTTVPAIDADGLPFDDEVIVTGAGEYIGDGQYLCTYTATVAKPHTLRVYINDMEIDGSPFTPVVIPNRMNNTLSVVTGSGLEGSVAGVLAPVHIKAVDA